MKVLEIDLETAPTKAYVWALFDQNVSIDQIVEPGYTLSFAFKWQHEKAVGFRSLWELGAKKLAAEAHALLNAADAVVHYNGNKYDIPILNRDFLLHGLTPPSHYQNVDLYQTVRRRFKFASNKLDFVCQQLGLGNKVRHKGMALWRDVMGGVDTAQRTMARYNKQDVRLLERLYYRVQPWVLNHPNRGLWVEDPKSPVCRNCGSSDVMKNGTERRTTLMYQRYECRACGTPLRGRLSLGKASPNVLV